MSAKMLDDFHQKHNIAVNYSEFMEFVMVPMKHSNSERKCIRPFLMRRPTCFSYLQVSLE